MDSYPRPNSFKMLFASLYDFGRVLYYGNASANSFNIAVKAELLILYSDFI